MCALGKNIGEKEPKLADALNESELKEYFNQLQDERRQEIKDILRDTLDKLSEILKTTYR